MDEELKNYLDHRFEAVDVRIDGMGRELRGEMAGMRDELRGEMTGMRDELRGEMVGMRTELRHDFTVLIERVERKIDFLVDGFKLNYEKISAVAIQCEENTTALDLRVTSLEAANARRRRR